MTRDELKQLSNNTFFDNNNGEIEPSGHRFFNAKLIDSVLPAIDLASISEVATGEIYNGKPVYAKRIDITIAVGEQQPGFNTGLPVSTISDIWLDVNQCRGKSGIYSFPLFLPSTSPNEAYDSRPALGYIIRSRGSNYEVLIDDNTGYSYVGQIVIKYTKNAG
ncbi:MAG: hypothetical protein LBE13_16545 [Bacteroidales bacterium]|jgi:hypothetical protein|nr:hypothetical protein [Bacteroidales bacterium]